MVRGSAVDAHSFLLPSSTPGFKKLRLASGLRHSCRGAFMLSTVREAERALVRRGRRGLSVRVA